MLFDRNDTGGTPSQLSRQGKALLQVGIVGTHTALVLGQVHGAPAHDLDVFKKSLGDKLNAKPEECLVEPRMQVVGPAIENVKYCMDEPQISEMFQNLLANAADERYQSKVHPSFPAMIAQMSPLDAENLGLFRQVDQYPIVEFRYILFDDTFRTAQSNVFAANPKMTT